MRTAILAGATGLIGSHLLELLLNDKHYTRVIALSRKPLEQKGDELRNLVLDFDNINSRSAELQGDDVFCCLGTTMKQAGSREEFRKVDFGYPVALADATKRAGARQFLLVSAQGANSKSMIFYNRVKGEVEEALQKFGFESLHIFRPSLLVGARRQERRGEKAFGAIMGALNFAIPGKYKPIEGAKVARAMLMVARMGTKGNFVYGSEDLQAY
jgi:uncharacterized protein YbjT (DUF2867 family)